MKYALLTLYLFREDLGLCTCKANLIRSILMIKKLLLLTKKIICKFGYIDIKQKKIKRCRA